MLLKKNQLKYLALSSIGIQFGLCVAVGAVGGYFLDVYFETKPYLVALGIFLGLAAAVRSMIREIMIWEKKYANDDDNNG